VASSGRTRRRRSVAAVVVLVGAFSGLSTVRADPLGTSGELRRVDYQAPPDCPTASDFFERLHARAHARRPPEGATPALVVRVTRREHGVRVHGELSVRYVDGSDATRTVDGDACDSVVDALALMSAMALDPTASLDGTSAPPAEPQPVAAVTDDLDGSLPIDVRSGWHVAVGAGGGATFVIAPVGAPDGTGFLELVRGGTVWSPSVRVGFEYASSGAVGVAGGDIKLGSSLGVLDVCPASWRLGAFRLAPCVRLEGGVLDVSGVDVMPAKSALRPWAAAGALGRVRYVPLARFFVELSGGVLAPLVRDHFYFDPSDTTVFRPPVASGFAGGAVGITIR
jgi:hypothetical protein